MFWLIAPITEARSTSHTMRVLFLSLLGLALFGGARAQYDDEEGYGGEGGYGGEEEPPPPPPPEDGGGGQELTSLEDFDAFLDNDDASVICAVTTKMMPDQSKVHLLKSKKM